MDKQQIKQLLERFLQNKISITALTNLLSSSGFTDLGHTKVDTTRLFRTGYPEVVFCKNKKTEEIATIAHELFKKNNMVLLTKTCADHYTALKPRYQTIEFHKDAQIIFIGNRPKTKGIVSVLSGGTSDIPVAEEAAITAELFGCTVQRFYDVGIAGLHRLLSYQKDIQISNAIIAVAGMEGALPSVVGGLFGIPIIGVPTSIGYGTSFNGITPLLTMLNSCSPGVSVVNIDNGFGAGYIASTINRMIEEAKSNE